MKEKNQKLAREQLDGLVRKAFGYNDEQLVEEFNHFRKAMGSEKFHIPKYEFMLIMNRLEQFKTQSKIRQFQILAKASVIVSLFTLTFAVWGLPVIANYYYGYISEVKEQDSKTTARSSTPHAIKSSITSEEIAYIEIEEQLGIAPLRLWYMPSGMRFKGFNLSSVKGTIVFEYKGHYIYVSQMKVLEQGHFYFVRSDLKCDKHIYNEHIQIRFDLEENELSKGTTEYGVSFSKDGVYYRVTGIMEEEVFEEMVSTMFIH